MIQKRWSEGERERTDMEQIDVHMPSSRHRLDDGLRMLWANEAFYHMLGYDEEITDTAFVFSSYFSKYMQEFQFMQDTLHTAILNNRCHVNLFCHLTTAEKGDIAVGIVATITETHSKDKEVLFCYTPLQELLKEHDRLLTSKKEMTDNFEWMMSVYTGNVYICDMDTYELLYVNKCSCDTLQANEGQLLGRKCYEAIQGLQAPCPFCTNAYLKKDETYSWEFYNPNLKRTFMIQDRMLDWFGHRARIELSFDMYSEEYRLAKKDQEREAILKTIPAGMVRIDARDNNTILWYNGIFLDMIGYTQEQLEEELNSCCFQYVHPDDLPRTLEVCKSLKNTGDNAVLEARAFTRSKEERVWTVTLCYISGEDSWDGIPSFYSLGLDITNERRQMESLRHKAEKDALTGSYNRGTLEGQIQSWLKEYPDSIHALIMVDTDNFKQINDTHGHIIGDLVLSEMVAGMKRIIRSTDIVGRIGGDEFAIFLKRLPSKQAAKGKAEELLAMFRNLFTNEEKPVRVTCSMGVALYPDDGADFKALYESADKALYQAKTQGKDSYCIYDKSRLNDMDIAVNSSLGTKIDSEQDYSESSDNLARYVFRTLYRYENLDEAIRLIFEIIGKQFGISRAYILKSSQDAGYAVNTYAWCGKGISFEKELLQSLCCFGYEDYKSLFRDSDCFYCRDIHTLAPPLAAYFHEQGVQSTLQFAFYEHMAFCGFIGFDECTGHRFWTQEEISSLALVAQILATFLKIRWLAHGNDHSLG